jgi:hypothetical protein
MGPLHLETPPNQQIQIGLKLQPDHLTGAQQRVGLSALNVANRATELRIAANERNMIRVYLLTRGNAFDEQGEEEEQEATFDDYGDVEEEFVTGDNRPSLMVRRICFTPRKVEGDDKQRHNLFHSTCTIGGKVCKLVIDEGCCENVVTEKAV